MATVITPITCVAKTSKDTKKLWESKGLKVEDCVAKLSYEYLSGLEGTATGAEIKNIISDAATKIAALYEARIKVESRKELMVNSMSFWQELATGLAFGKTILASAKREMSGLEFAEPKSASASVEDDSGEVVTEEL